MTVRIKRCRDHEDAAQRAVDTLLVRPNGCAAPTDVSTADG